MFKEGQGESFPRPQQTAIRRFDLTPSSGLRWSVAADWLQDHGGVSEEMSASAFRHDLWAVTAVIEGRTSRNNGDGNGYSYGDGDGSGSGDGYGDGHGDGSGHGRGGGRGSGDGRSSGRGSGDGYGDGHGDGSGCGSGSGSG